MIKKIGKRLLPILLAVIMLFSVLPMQAFAVTAGQPYIDNYYDFLTNLAYLEGFAYQYVNEMNPNADPLDLVIKYVRTGVDRYNSGSWGIMAGYEDKEFAEFIATLEAMYNEQIDSEGLDMDYFRITNLKNIKNLVLPNGEKADLGHVFGTLDIANHNKDSENHADVGGWAGDLVDLLELSDKMGVTGTVEEMTEKIAEDCLGIVPKDSGLPSFSDADLSGDLDAYYILQKLNSQKYAPDPSEGYFPLVAIISEYFTEDLTPEKRAEYFLKNRLGTTGTRDQIREVVYKEYTGNKVVSTLEGTRDFNSTGLDLMNLRKASCYAFADYLCELAGDYVEKGDNPYFTVFSSEITSLAPGVTQEIKYANSADEKQMIYYIATADVTRNDVDVFANYNENDPSKGWAMARVLDQANAAQEKYGNPESEHYIENYNVVASTNGAGYNMETGEPGGLLVMGGVEYHPINTNGFVGMLKDGTPVIGTTEEYNTIYKDKLRDGIAAFGATLVKDGKNVVTETTNYYNDRASRTAMGITKTGKVVLMVLDGRQGDYSNGGSMVEIAQIMLEAGCVHAVNLDGGGSTTYVAKQVGEDHLSVINSPSDGYARSVSTSLMIVSTAPSSTKFDHAVLETEYDYMTKNTSIQITPVGVSATGNTTDLPEATSWTVSDEKYATITEDGILTAKSNGSVEVYLMADGAVIGSKLITITDPDKVYFKKNKVDAIYESTVKIPVLAGFNNNPIAFNENDVEFELSNEKAGVIEGFNFKCAAKSEMRSVKVTVKLVNNTIANPAELTINLYDQGEATFDFEQATGGDRMLAWDRKVTNSTTTDNINYEIVDADKDMTTSYIFAMDMTAIPIPEVLSDLVYMLPGADVEGVNAWMFLCQLADRISTLTEVKATLNFDPRFDVDYSKIVIVNEYFTVKDMTFDEEKNQLVFTMKWNKQDKPIDVETANSLCIVSGIKLTPKADADWGSKNTISAVNTGEISYMVYMRASALYSFALKEENQQKYGIVPYVNPELESDKGGGFGSTYTQLNDTYNLLKTIKDGWTYEDGGYAYYVNGEKLTGVKEVDGFYYDFGENGISFDQAKYTGVFYDESAKVYRYAKLGEITTGWNLIDNEWYYFNPSTKAAAVGRTKMFGIYYTFEETGRLTSGVWANTLEGTRYYYGPGYHTSKWQEIDGGLYYFRNGYCLKGYQYISGYNAANIRVSKWYDLGDDGRSRGYIPDGFYEFDGKYYYVVEGTNQLGLQKIGDDYYFFLYTGEAVTDKKYYAFETHCDLPVGEYTFGADGKMLNGIVEKSDGYYYYTNGKTGKEYGLLNIDGDYYFVLMNGKLITSQTYYAWETRCDLPKGNYSFGPDGKLVNGIAKMADGYYYYVKGKTSEKYGLIKIGDDYYLALMNGKLITNQVYNAWVTNCDLPTGNYEFGADGKMLQGIVKKSDGYYYYQNGRAGRTYGLVKVGEDYYFALMNGKLITNQVYYAWETKCDLPKSNYEFGADGKMLQGIVEKSDGYYYYINGKAGRKYGLLEIDGDYYFALMNGKLITNQVYYAWETNCNLPKGSYEFGADGKMLQGIVEKSDGYYYYIDGRAGRKYGLLEIDGNYYFALMNGKLITNQVYYAWETNCDLPKSNYEFGADGKMLNGIVEKSDGYYYYTNGKTGKEYGLLKIDGYYYLVLMNGKIITNQVYNAWVTNCDLPRGNYEFGADGKMLNGIVEKSDGYYYYVNGKPGSVYGLFKLDGYYYFALMNGKLITNQKYNVWQGNGLLIETVYTFNEFGQIVG